MSHTCGDASWRWWTGENFEEEWHATNKACGARATVLGKYFPNAYERMSQYQKGRLLDVELPKTKSSNPSAELMFCDSTILSREDHCCGFTYCVQHKHPNGPRYWFCDDCSKCYHQRLSQGKNIYYNEDEKEEWIEVKQTQWQHKWKIQWIKKIKTLLYFLFPIYFTIFIVVYLVEL